MFSSPEKSGKQTAESDDPFENAQIDIDSLLVPQPSLLGKRSMVVGSKAHAQ